MAANKVLKTESAAIEIAERYKRNGNLSELIRGVYDKGVWLGRYCNTYTREQFVARLISELTEQKGEAL